MNQGEVKNTIEEILKYLTVSYDDIEIITGNTNIVFMIKTTEAPSLIGHNGGNLLALNHIVKRIIEQKSPDNKENFMVDVNEYQKKRNDELKQKAMLLAGRVKSFKSDTELDPMTSYERMIIHATLAEDPEIETQSTGFGRERRVVIKYKEEALE